jgi:uncharacterized protein (DUF952 family)
MVPRVTWDALPSSSAYYAETLDSEGFVHCTAEPAMLEVVANRYYRNEPGDWLILAVDLEQVRAEVRWEAADEHLFPHIYGPIERCAVVRIVPFPRRHDGTYSLPEDSL